MRKKIVVLTITIIVLFIFYLTPISTSLLYSYFGFHVLYIQSGSMEPTIEIGEAVIIQKQENYEKDDIVTYYTQEKYLVTHRIQRKDEEGYKTKGDHNNREDKEIVEKEKIQGKVIFHAKWLGILIQYKWMVILILWLLLLIGLYI